MVERLRAVDHRPARCCKLIEMIAAFRSFGQTEPMMGDQRRGALARSLLRVRAARQQSFPSELFDEHAWNILLHLFSALSRNEVVSEADLVERSGAKLSVGRSWLRHLVADGQIVARQDGDDVAMSDTAIRNMRYFLDAALVIHAEAIAI